MIPLKVQTKESADDAQLKENVLTNLGLLDRWVGDAYETHGTPAKLVSFGKSFRENSKEMLEDMGEGDIICVKHCLPLFEELDVKPKFCVILDPREADGTSTLGYKRRDLLKVYPETTYLVASMTHPSVTVALLEAGANVIGWHSACEAMKDPEVAAKVSRWIVGGSCSAMRAVSLSRILGYRNIKMGGFDAIVDQPEGFTERKKGQIDGLLDIIKLDLEEEDLTKLNDLFVPAIELYSSKKMAAMFPKEENSSIVSVLDQYAEDGKLVALRVSIGTDIMWCTPELAAMAQDIEGTFLSNTDVKYEVFSGGVAGAIWDTLGGAEKINPIKEFVTT